MSLNLKVKAGRIKFVDGGAYILLTVRLGNSELKQWAFVEIDFESKEVLDMYFLEDADVNL